MRNGECVTVVTYSILRTCVTVLVECCALMASGRGKAGYVCA